MLELSGFFTAFTMIFFVWFNVTLYAFSLDYFLNLSSKCNKVENS